MSDLARVGNGRKSSKGYPFGAKPNWKRWQSYLRFKGKRIVIGQFDTAEEASRAALALKQSILLQETEPSPQVIAALRAAAKAAANA